MNPTISKGLPADFPQIVAEPFPIPPDYLPLRNKSDNSVLILGTDSLNTKSRRRGISKCEKERIDVLHSHVGPS